MHSVSSLNVSSKLEHHSADVSPWSLLGISSVLVVPVMGNGSCLLVVPFSVLFVFFDLSIVFKCMSTLPECMCMYLVHAWCLQMIGEGVRAPGTGATKGYEPPCKCWKWKLSPKEHQEFSQVLRSSLQ